MTKIKKKSKWVDPLDRQRKHMRTPSIENKKKGKQQATLKKIGKQQEVRNALLTIRENYLAACLMSAHKPRKKIQKTQK
jgi:hypothetical protein